VHVVDERDRVDHELVGGALAFDFDVRQITPDAHAGAGDPLERIGHLVKGAPEP
jgi:hypothetical protein